MWGWRGAAVDPIIRNCELVLREGGERDEEVGASGVAAAAMREGGGTGREDWSYAGFCVFADCRHATRRDGFTPLEKRGRPGSVLPFAGVLCEAAWQDTPPRLQPEMLES
jgi:hypothetical protein